SSSDPGSANGVAVDSNDNVYVAGFFNGTTDFAPGAHSLTTNDSHSDAFVVKLNPAGNWVYAHPRNSNGNDAEANAIAVDSAGHAYYTGTLGSRAFAQRLKLDGTSDWSDSTGGNNGSAAGLGIAIDGSGKAYVTGSFSGTVDFNPGNGGNDNQSSNGGTDIFVWKLNADGTESYSRDI